MNRARFWISEATEILLIALVVSVVSDLLIASRR